MTDLVQAKSNTRLSINKQSLSHDANRVRVSKNNQPSMVDTVVEQDAYGSLENEYENIDDDDGVRYCQLDSDIDLPDIKEEVQGDEKVLDHSIQQKQY